MTLVPAAGSPTCSTSRHDASMTSRFGRDRLRSLRRVRRKYTVPRKIVPRAISDAIAAPSSPMAGIGPKPKIKIGSRMTLSTDARTMSVPGSRVSPVARMLDMPTMPTTTKGTPR